MDIDIDVILRHEVYLDKLNSGFIDEDINPQLSDMFREIKAYIDANGLPRTLKQLESMEATINKIIVTQSPWENYTNNLMRSALYETGYMNTALSNQDLTVPGIKTTRTFIGQQLMALESSSGARVGFWNSFIQGNITNSQERVNNAVRDGFARGQSISAVLRDIRQQFAGPIQTDAVKLARTAFVHYTQQARRAMVAENPNYYQEAIFVAVWDNRTSLTCRGFSGTRWKANDRELPIPPLHYHCRSTLVYGPTGFKLVGGRAAIGGREGEAAEKKFTSRSRLTGKKPEYKGKKDLGIFKPEEFTTRKQHENWLAEQPRWFVDSALGKTRAALFLDGNLELKRFTDMTGATLTLDQLRVADADAFTKAGL